MKRATFPFLLVAAFALLAGFLMRSSDTLPVGAAAADADADAAAKAAEPLRVLLIAGGCCHDYKTQTELLKAGIESRINAVVTVDFNPDSTTEAKFDSYQDDDWAEDYDLIVHDECSANVTDPDYVKRIIDAHRAGVPAVNLHCAMHSYRWGEFKEAVKLGADNAGWYEMIGIQSTGHGPQSPINIIFEKNDHPITKGFEDWTTINEELYNNVQVFDSATILARGTQIQKPKGKGGQGKGKGKNGQPAETAAETDAPGKEVTEGVVWTNVFGPNKTRIFSTTIGHNNETVADDRYLDLVTRGLLWATGKLGDDGKAVAGYGK